MILYRGIIKETRRQFYYSVKRVWGAKRYTADCAMSMPVDVLPTWHKTLTEARREAELAGTIYWVEPGEQRAA